MLAQKRRQTIELLGQRLSESELAEVVAAGTRPAEGQLAEFVAVLALFVVVAAAAVAFELAVAPEGWPIVGHRAVAVGARPTKPTVGLPAVAGLVAGNFAVQLGVRL